MSFVASVCPNTVIHVPHASTVVPDQIRPSICLTDEELQHELLVMTDRYTDDLFGLPSGTATTVLFPVSRLVVDPERFVDDSREPMSAKGMGVIYNRTSDGKVSRHALSTVDRDSLLNTYYYPHQDAVRDAVSGALAAHGKCLIVDAHSFPSKPLPHEPDQSPNRCPICIGTDDFHTPPWLVKWLKAAFETRGFVVAVNQPFAGTFVPTRFYHQDRKVLSVMIEVNRGLYMDEASGERLSSYTHVQSSLRQVLLELTVAIGEENRLRGALFGLAVGDALGAAVEFMSPGTFEPVAGYRDGGPHGLAPGEWTDDTSMALALAGSMAAGEWDLNDQAQRYVRWWQHGEYSVNDRCFDIGMTTRAALARFTKHGDARRSGDSGERASGNGSIMRLAPVPIRYRHLFPDAIDELARLGAESSLPTHASPQCLSACRYMAVVLAGLMAGVDRNEVLSPDWDVLRRLREVEPLHRAVDEVAAGSFRQRQPPEIVGSGYVVRSLEAALWAFHDAGSFEEAVLRAVNLGDDADTTGAVCGQLAGAYWGETGIPPTWRDGLARRNMIEAALTGIIE